MFNDRDLNYYWQEYAGQLPKEQDALAKRMQMLRPALLNNSTTLKWWLIMSLLQRIYSFDSRIAGLSSRQTEEQ